VYGLGTALFTPKQWLGYGKYCCRSSDQDGVYISSSARMRIWTICFFNVAETMTGDTFTPKQGRGSIFSPVQGLRRIATSVPLLR
jgi:hypothetical protein